VTRREDVEQPVGVGGDNRLAHRERFEGGERRPSRGWKHAEVERRKRTPARRDGAGEDEPIAQAELSRLRSRSRSSGPSLPERTAPAAVQHDARGGGDRKLLPFDSWSRVMC